MTIDQSGLQILDRSQCLALVRRATIGRVGFVDRERPVVLPVNFWLDGDDRVVIRTSGGSKMGIALRHGEVAFEVDDFDAFEHTGWSVLVTGRAEVLDPGEMVEAPVPRWAPTGEEAMVAIATEVVTGRRIARR